MSRLFTALAAAGLLSFAAAVRADVGNDALAKLQGDWQVVAIVLDGETIAPEKLAGSHAVFDQDVMTLSEGSHDADPRRFRITFAADPASRDIELESLNGMHVESVSPGIYQLEGDVLTLCTSNDPDRTERPADFASAAGSKLIVLTFKRIGR